MVGVGEKESTRRAFTDVVSANYFSVLGVMPIQGRTFRPEEETPGRGAAVAIVSYNYWKKQGLSPATLGSTITIDSRPFTVVGILPQGFTGTTQIFSPEIFLPLGVYDQVANDFETANKGKLITGLVAPTYELKHAGPIYAWAYKELQEAQQPDVLVIIGTAHAGLEQPFALTDKDFETPLGIVPVDRAIVERLKVLVPEYFSEDVAHLSEHAIEFQLPFVQTNTGATTAVTIVPVLSSFSAMSLNDPSVRGSVDRFLAALREAISVSGKTSCVIAAGELAHLGMRYGDKAPPTDFSFHRSMQYDLEMLKFVEDLKPEEFVGYIQKEKDERRISGFSPIYCLLRLIQAEKGQVLRYDRGITDQYNSTVTYASMSFF